MATRNIGGDIFDPAGGAPTLGVIDDLGDVDTTTTPPVVNDVLTWDGVNWVPAVAQNWATTNLTVTADRTHDISGNSMSFTNGTNVDWSVAERFRAQSSANTEVFLDLNGTTDAALFMLQDVGGGAFESRLDFAIEDVSLRMVDNGGTRTASVGLRAGPVSAAGDPQLFLQTAGVFQGISTVGQVLALADAATGEVEFANAALDTNFAINDLTFTGNRTHDVNGNFLIIDNLLGSGHTQYSQDLTTVRLTAEDPGVSQAQWSLNNGGVITANAQAISLQGDPNVGNPLQLQFRETGNVNYVGFAAPAVLAGNQIWTLPIADGTAGQVLSTNGAGVLAWSSAGGADMNLLADDLTQIANRAQDFGGFDQTWTNMGVWSTNGTGTQSFTVDTIPNGLKSITVAPTNVTLVAQNPTVTDVTSINMTPNEIDLSFIGAADLKLSGNAGLAGQVATSGGPGVGPSWTTAGVDTNLVTTDLGPQIALRTHDLAGFGQAFTNAGPFTVTGAGSHALTSASGANTARISLSQAASTVDLRASSSAIERSQLILDATGGRLFASDALANEAGFNVQPGVITGLPQLHLETSEILVGGTATVGQVVTLLSATTGEVEFADTADTNIIHNSLTAIASQNQDMAGFSQAILNANGITLQGAGQLGSASATGGVTAQTLLEAATPQASIQVIDALGNYGFIVQDGAVLGTPQTHVRTNAVDNATAVNGQVLSLIDAASGEVEFATNVAVDTHILNTDLSATAARNHDFGGFGQDWEDIGEWTVESLNGDLIDIHANSGTIFARFMLPAAFAGAQMRYEDTATSLLAQVQVNATSAGLLFVDGAGVNTSSVSVLEGVIAGRPTAHLVTGNVDAGTAVAGQVLTLVGAGTGEAEWQAATVADNLGNHIATQDLDMSGFDIVNTTTVNGFDLGIVAANNPGVGSTGGAISVDAGDGGNGFSIGGAIDITAGDSPATALGRGGDVSIFGGDGLGSIAGSNGRGGDVLLVGGVSNALAPQRGGRIALTPGLGTAGHGDIELVTAAVQNASAVLGQVLTITSAATGATEWQDTQPPTFELFSSPAVAINTTTTFQSKIGVSTSVLPIGTYEIVVSFGWNHDATTSDMEVQFLWDAAALTVFGSGLDLKAEPKDSAGNTSGTGSSQAFAYTKVFYVALGVASLHTVDLEFRTDAAGVESSMWDAVVSVKRVL